MEGGGEMQNFTNWPTEFGKIFRGKLWALQITSTEFTNPRTKDCNENSRQDLNCRTSASSHRLLLSRETFTTI